ncbi:MAG: hypothetical protein MJ252_26075 [archaeon]|nr:hypothetical protein [archaeon]
MEFTIVLMEIDMKEDLNMIRKMEMVFITLLMEVDTKENSEMTKEKEKGKYK